MSSIDIPELPKIFSDANGDLEIKASESSSHHDFDFFSGKWKLKNKKLKSRLTQCTEWIEFESTQEMYIILNGIGNIDNFLTEFDGVSFEGMTVRLFNPKTRLWKIYWASSDTGILEPPVVGSFENDIGHFFTRDTLRDQQILTVFRWDARDKDNPVWSQACSGDNGKTWEWNWYMFMSRI